MSVLDHLTEDEIDSMLHQHTRYSFGDVSVSLHEPTGRWFCYRKGKELHVQLGAEEPRGYETLYEAIDFAISPSTTEMIEQLRPNNAT